ncbi:actin-related protein 2/3 complex subunit 1B-like [Lolium rigidum]|uniref:actin-related protein 2/3 complex subunit 1B-like n=1 Tax=Lolium rigidum TaxID=89674 RepID=UPI001F5CBA19|nr:actin-related protein 2/3 complex subunit 1B-like [Lolium rigidum]XP_047080300.1 actin-related protein 2/3 complex subunit 1B-like [Lolium rigidum]
MAAQAIHQFAECITCHAWSPDHSMIAFCPNNTEVHIYKFIADKWEKLHVLSKHDQIVSGIDWGRSTNKIVTVSHDRNSYVWTQEGQDWVPTLVILKLNRAALCVQWSPKENKFAVGSGAKSVCICYYEQENNWWISKIIRKKHESTVTSIAWHPNNIHLATTSTDGKCRVFSTIIKGVDTRGSQGSASADWKFGEQIAQLDLSTTWAFGVRWSPSGKTLAYAGHSSMIYFVEDVEASPAAQNLALRDLPLRDILFVSERMAIGVGFDCNPLIFAADDTGLWSFVRYLDERKVTPSASKASQLSEALGKLYGQSRQGTSSDTVEPTKPRGGAHENCITCIVPLRKGSETIVKRFSTSGLDGKIVVWDLENHVTITK